MNPPKLSDLGDFRMEATVKSPRLARGLNALLGDLTNPHVSESSVTRLALSRIAFNPYQPRKLFDPDELASLTSSIKTHGVLQPLVVRPDGNNYQLVAGERRFHAAKAAGLTEVPVHVVEFNDQQSCEAALVENIQRSDLNAIEKAEGFKVYMERFRITYDQLGGRLGLDRTTVSNFLGLLNLHADVQAAVRSGQLTLGHAKALKGVTDLEKQVAFAKEAMVKNYSVHALELLIKQHKLTAAGIDAPAEPPARKELTEKTAHVKGLEDEIRQRLAVKVDIRVKAKDKGQIVIAFDSNDDFERVIQALQK